MGAVFGACGFPSLGTRVILCSMRLRRVGGPRRGGLVRTGLPRLCVSIGNFVVEDRVKEVVGEDPVRSPFLFFLIHPQPLSPWLHDHGEFVHCCPRPSPSRLVRCCTPGNRIRLRTKLQKLFGCTTLFGPPSLLPQSVSIKSLFLFFLKSTLHLIVLMCRITKRGPD